MNYISIKNLEKYQPTYKDGRKHIWIRWDISALSDYKVVSMPVDGKWMFLCLICMATETNNNVPEDLPWLSHISGVDKKRIPMILNKLHDLGILVTKCDEMSQNVPSTYRQTDVQTDRQEPVSKSHTKEIFDYFCLKTNRSLKFTSDREKLIKEKLKDGYTIDQFKTAIDNFSKDDWEGRSGHIDLIYCIGKQKGKADNMEKWLHSKEKKNDGKSQYREFKG